MYAKQILGFLNSMDKSCENYSDQALSQRRRLQEVNSEFKKIDQNVKNSINVVRRESLARPKSTKRQQSSYAQKSSRRPKTTPETPNSRMVIRPAPYPVKNYILPAQELVGPKRYYRSRAAQKRKDENEEMLDEFEKFPNSFEKSPRAQPPELVVTSNCNYTDYFKNEKEIDDWGLDEFHSFRIDSEIDALV
ncbi:hypothetical protein TRFO_23179 [Tritrichomonas foetus]|uniref:Uncharacterized protein n=1 Tax=Tritrichomonas foetus TaxID=1144522 RepID=A0A1J4KA99_9EUKA|nr:hypothetical protein TRFO_23179 [Tritrichomonas foetus]|eukprot:OHT08351.1 hypothetical protein TRFO_23179 [Tritrichomonas foetus]